MPIFRRDVTVDLKPAVRPAVTFDLDVEPYFMGGGAEARKHDPVWKIRPTSVLGQVRWFWRLLHPELGVDDLRTREAKIFGGPSVPASFGLSVSILRPGTPATLPDPGEPGGYLLFSARETDTGLPAADLSKRVAIAVSVASLNGKAFDASLVRAIKLWSMLGGVGARTRRGVGAVQLTGAEAPRSADDVKRRITELLPAPGVGAAGRTVRMVWVGREFSNAVDCFEAIDQRYRKYRQDRPEGLGHNRWDEADEIRRTTARSRDGYTPQPPRGHHPGIWARGVLGLPIVFKFKDNDDPEVTTLRPAGDPKSDRMASPLLMRPLRLSTGRYVPIVALLTGPYVRGAGFVLDGATPQSVPVTPHVERVFSDLLPGLSAKDPAANPLGLKVIYP